MELKLDTSKIYAIALEGGGARGAWQVGAWRALEEAGVRYNAVSGTSVGAINGALMAMRDLKQAEQIWHETDRWNKMSLANIAGSGIFAADRAINEYGENIWHADKID